MDEDYSARDAAILAAAAPLLAERLDKQQDRVLKNAYIAIGKGELTPDMAVAVLHSLKAMFDLRNALTRREQ